MVLCISHKASVWSFVYIIAFQKKIINRKSINSHNTQISLSYLYIITVGWCENKSCRESEKPAFRRIPAFRVRIVCVKLNENINIKIYEARFAVSFLSFCKYNSISGAISQIV